jgi:hypothetical protein
MALGDDMETARNRKIDQIPSDLQREVRDVDSKLQMLKTDALTKGQALAVAFVVCWIVFLLALAITHH